jgi:hypothetical protein
VVAAYYGDIESGDYTQAYALLGNGATTGQSYAEFVAGFSCTGGQLVSENWESGDQVNFNLAATDSCTGATQYFTGTDTVQNARHRRRGHRGGRLGDHGNAEAGDGARERLMAARQPGRSVPGYGTASAISMVRSRRHFRTTSRSERLFRQMGRVKESWPSDPSKPVRHPIAVTPTRHDLLDSTERLPRDMSYDYFG